MGSEPFSQNAKSSSVSSPRTSEAGTTARNLQKLGFSLAAGLKAMEVSGLSDKLLGDEMWIWMPHH